MDGLLQKLRAQREFWVELEPGKRVKLRRPGETEFGRLAGGIGVEDVKRCAIAWEGITEADLLGPDVGVEDAVPFEPAVFAEVISDRAAWAELLAKSIADAIVTHLQARKDASGN